MQKKYFFPALLVSGLMMIPVLSFAAPPSDGTGTGKGPSAIAATLSGSQAGSYVIATAPHKSVNSRAAERIKFMRESGYPEGRPGYVVDYIVPTECGGTTDINNMQWLTEEEANKKAQEKKDCPDKNPDKNK